jgi:hypothetical protein
MPTPITPDWVRRNIGDVRPRSAAPALSAALEPNNEALQRELIDFDSQAAAGAAFRALAPAAPGDLNAFVDIEWPAGSAPQPSQATATESLPEGDVLIITWTMDEGHALSRVLTPGFDSRDDWLPYRKNFDRLSSEMSPECPARQYGWLGTYGTTVISGKRVTLFKSDSHMSQDGPVLVNAEVLKQLITDVKPSWVISTGTGGAIGLEFEVGDVIVSRFATFDCQREFAHLDGKSYGCTQSAPAAEFGTAEQLFEYNGGFLPRDNTRKPTVIQAQGAESGILTTDFFGFANTTDTYGLVGKGSLAEMGDAVLGMVCAELGDDAPSYVFVRNVSDPEIDATGLTLAQQAAIAADIYKAYGRWSTVCSAIVCWALIAATSE